MAAQEGARRAGLLFVGARSGALRLQDARGRAERHERAHFARGRGAGPVQVSVKSIVPPIRNVEPSHPVVALGEFIGHVHVTVDTAQVTTATYRRRPSS